MVVPVRPRARGRVRDADQGRSRPAALRRGEVDGEPQRHQSRGRRPHRAPLRDLGHARSTSSVTCPTCPTRSRNGRSRGSTAPSSQAEAGELYPVVEKLCTHALATPTGAARAARALLAGACRRRASTCVISSRPLSTSTPRWSPRPPRDDDLVARRGAHRARRSRAEDRRPRALVEDARRGGRALPRRRRRRRCRRVAARLRPDAHVRQRQ